MIHAIRSEITKLTTTPLGTVLTVLIGTGALAGPVAMLALFSRDEVGTPAAPAPIGSLMDGMFVFIAVATVVGASSTASDIRNRMHAHAFLTQRRRHQWLVAKMSVLAGFVAGAYVIGMIGVVVVALAFGGRVDFSDPTPMVVGLLAAPAIAVMAAGFASLVRSQTIAVAVALVWLMVVEQILYAMSAQLTWLEPVVDGLLSVNFQNMVAGTDIGQGAAVYAAWLVALVIGGLVANRVRDVR